MILVLILILIPHAVLLPPQVCAAAGGALAAAEAGREKVCEQLRWALFSDWLARGVTAP